MEESVSDLTAKIAVNAVTEIFKASLEGAGLETARRKGKRLGGPSKEPLAVEIKRLATKEQMSKRAIAKKLKISRPTVYKYYPS